jgi:hypothetical protein
MCFWWWVELPPETCRAVYRNIVNCIWSHFVGQLFTLVKILSSWLPRQIFKINRLCLNHQSQSVSELSFDLNHMTRLSDGEDFIKFCHLGSFKTYTENRCSKTRKISGLKIDFKNLWILAFSSTTGLPTSIWYWPCKRKQNRSKWPRGLKCRSAVSRLLRSWVRIPPGCGCLSVEKVGCCQVEVCATSWLLVQRSLTDCGASLCVI